jgi:hypothetical protein
LLLLESLHHERLFNTKRIQSFLSSPTEGSHLLGRRIFQLLNLLERDVDRLDLGQVRALVILRLKVLERRLVDGYPADGVE